MLAGEPLEELEQVVVPDDPVASLPVVVDVTLLCTEEVVSLRAFEIHLDLVEGVPTLIGGGGGGGVGLFDEVVVLLVTAPPCCRPGRPPPLALPLELPPLPLLEFVLEILTLFPRLLRLTAGALDGLK